MIVRRAVALVMCGMLATPASAWAATSVNVEGTDYTTASSGSGGKGGTWAWDGADGMALDSYEGGAISAVGDLAITAKGDNVIDTTDDPGTSAIEVTGGDISITGDSLTAKSTDNRAVVASNGDVNITDATVDVESGGDTVAALVSVGGDVTIDGSTVKATMTNDYGYECSAIYASGGNVTIKNGSNVTATSDNADNGTTSAIYATSSDTRADSAQLSIVDSTVKATTTGANADWARGIQSFSNSAGVTPRINITRSNVTASGSAFAILSWSRVNDETPAGTISITDSTITTPAGATIQDVHFVPPYGDDFGGQTIGTGLGTITALDSADIAKDVTIEVSKEQEPTISTATYVTRTSFATPGTGDPLADSGVLAALVAGAAALLLAGMRTARRRDA